MVKPGGLRREWQWAARPGRQPQQTDPGGLRLDLMLTLREREVQSSNTME